MPGLERRNHTLPRRLEMFLFLSAMKQLSQRYCYIFSHLKYLSLHINPRVKHHGLYENTEGEENKQLWASAERIQIKYNLQSKKFLPSCFGSIAILCYTWFSFCLDFRPLKGQEFKGQVSNEISPS